MTMWLHGGSVVTPTSVLTGGGVLVVDGAIAQVADSAAPVPFESDEEIDLTGLFVLPGDVDLHVHGGGGSSFDDGTDAIASGLATHRANGTTRSLISLVSAPAQEMLARVTAAAGYASADPTVLGLHLEGPFLSVDRRGVHDRRSLRMPDPVLLHELLSAGRGQVAVVTVAPELPGGIELIGQLRAAGVHAAVGHSDADYGVARQAFAAGADLVTHAGNGMRPMHHREPGIIGAAMDAGVVLEVVNDGVHLHDATVRLLLAIAGNHVALVTDAMSATCAVDGMYRLGSARVRVTDGRAQLADGTIAGSTLTMGSAVRRAVRQIGMSLVEAVNAASLVPATLLGVSDRFGSIQVGRAADLVITDAELDVRAVLVAGEWVNGRRP